MFSHFERICCSKNWIGFTIEDEMTFIFNIISTVLKQNGNICIVLILIIGHNYLTHCNNVHCIRKQNKINIGYSYKVILMVWPYMEWDDETLKKKGKPPLWCT